MIITQKFLRIYFIYILFHLDTDFVELGVDTVVAVAVVFVAVFVFIPRVVTVVVGQRQYERICQRAAANQEPCGGSQQ